MLYISPADSFQFVKETYTGFADGFFQVFFLTAEVEKFSACERGFLYHSMKGLDFSPNMLQASSRKLLFVCSQLAVCR